MAVTKTHPVKSTLKAAIDYICNPDKTDGKLLVSSYGCTAETADIEFAWTRRQAIDKGTHLGSHLIQAFQPGEVTPEQAHEIGMELEREILGGKYEFVLTTHIDRDHVHNHLIFNAVSFTDHKHYHSNKRSYHFIRRTSDRLCKEHGLSVIIPGQDKGISYIEHQAERSGTSYKAKLRAAIDRLMPGCNDLEELLRRLQREGYEVKRGKYISCRAPEQERFTRLKTLGADYAEEALTARIAGRAGLSRHPKQRSGKISLLIDIQNNIKAQQSAGYKCRATNFTEEQKYFICSTYRKGKDLCTTHSIKNVVLHEIVLRNLREAIQYVSQHEAEFMQEAADISMRDRDAEFARKRDTLAKADKRIAELDRIISRLYEDNVMGKLSDDRFIKMSHDYELEQSNLKSMAEVLRKELKQQEQQKTNVKAFVAAVKKYTDMQELDVAVLREFIDCIEVSHADKKSKTREITIVYNFIGAFDFTRAIEEARNTTQKQQKTA